VPVKLTGSRLIAAVEPCRTEATRFLVGLRRF